MIICQIENSLRLVDQEDHARFAFELCREWTELADHPRREPLLLAIREHDNSWREIDAQPLLDPSTGLPHDFINLPTDERQTLWRRGIERAVEQYPAEVAQLIVHHAIELHRRRSQEPAWQQQLDSWQSIATRLRRLTGIPETTLHDDYRWLKLSDTLSLMVCNGWSEPMELLGLRTLHQRDCLYLDPFPYPQPRTFHVPCRWLPARPYDSETQLTEAMSDLSLQQFAVRVVPMSMTDLPKPS